MTLETLTEHMKELWLGDLIEATFCARREQLRRWAFVFLLRVAAIALVFGTPLVLAKAPTFAAAWVTVMVAEVALTVLTAHRGWMRRSRSFFSYGVFLAATCALVVGWSTSSAPMWLSAAGGFVIASIVSHLLAMSSSEERQA